MHNHARRWGRIGARAAFAATLALPVTLPPGPVMAEGKAASSDRIFLDKLPIPQAVYSRSGPVAAGKTRLVPFETAPFPYAGTVPATGRPFLDVSSGGRKGHRGRGGRVLWQDETFADRRVLLHIPEGFDIRRPSLMVVFFHGHGANLSADVDRRQLLPEQLTMAGTNAVLVAPQLAVKAADSSIGKLWQPGAFARMLGEAARELSKLHGDRRTQRTFATLPVAIVAYSGGYVAAAWSAQNGGLGRRLRGVVLLDALYGETGKFTDWVTGDRTRIFISAYTSSTRARNEELQRTLARKGISFSHDIGRHARRSNVYFMDVSRGSSHRNFVTAAWSDYPVADFLSRLGGYTR